MSLFVTSQNIQNVLEYNDTTGAFVKVAATGGVAAQFEQNRETKTPSERSSI